MLNEQNVNYPGTTHPPRQKLPVWILFVGIFVAGLAVSGLVYYFVTYWPPSTLQKIESGFVYLRASSTSGQVNAEVVVSNSDGSVKRVIQTIPNYIAEDYSGKTYDVSEEAGVIVYKITQEKSPGVVETSLWLSDRGQKPEKILTLPKDRFFQDVAISNDAKIIAYSLIHQETDTPPELWTVKPDGSENKMIIERMEKEDGVSFQLSDFTKDNKGVFLLPLNFDLDDSLDIFAADLATGKVTKFVDLTDILPKDREEVVENVSLSPDGGKVALSVFNAEEFEGVYQENVLIYIYDLNTNAIRPLYPASVGVGDYGFLSLRDIFWSNNARDLLYAVDLFDSEVKVVDTRSSNSEPVTVAKVNMETDAYVTPLGWVSEDRVVYAEDRPLTPNSTEFRMNFFTVKTDGSDKKLLDSVASNLDAFDVFENFILLGSFKEKEG